MNIKQILFLSLLLFGITSCQKDEEPINVVPENPEKPDTPNNPTEEDVITVAKNSVEVDFSGGEITVTVSHNISYTVSIDDECTSWITPSQTRATSNDTETFTIAPNTGVARRGYIYFLGDHSDARAYVEVFQNQDPNLGSNATDENRNANSTLSCQYANRLEFPVLSNNGHSVTIVHRTDDRYDDQGVNFCTEWDYQLESQRWSCYQMHTSNGGWDGSWSRYDYKNDADGEGRQYPWDADLSSQYYTAVDNFTGSGFDHGHVCPAADRNYSFLADKQTFYMTNMQPQYNAFNAGHWANLEKQIRTWASGYGVENIYVCKGATIDSESNIIKRINGKLIVPKYWFCALLKKTANGYSTIGFWMLNESQNRTNEGLAKFAVSVEELEQKTGLDFFCNLEDTLEEQLESSCDLSAWGLK